MGDYVRVAGVISSGRDGSHSAAMVRAAMEGAAAAGAQVQIIELPKQRIGYCMGCLACMKAGQCHQEDDFAAVKQTLCGADGIVWGAPVYGGAPNAIMKNLVDRLGMLEVLTSSLGGKHMAGIAAARSARTARKVARTLSRFGSSGTFARSRASGYLGEGFSGGRTADERVLEKARRLGARLVQDIVQKRRYPFQSLPQRLLSRLFLRPAFCRYILQNREGDARALYDNLHRRGLLA